MHRIVYAAVAPALLLIVGLSAGQDRQPLKAEGWGSLTGRILYDGNPPAPKSLVPNMSQHADKSCCLNPNAKPIEKEDNTWIVDPKTKGVANVLIYLKAPTGTYFPIHDKDKVRKDKVSLDQPHCMFVPHMLALYPSYFDGQKDVPTGEEFEIKNSAPVPHNTRAIGNPLKNPGFNVTLPPGSQKVFDLKPQPLPVLINCDIHPWMNAKVGVYDHPYFAITKEDGTFSIPRVPAGAEVTFMGWHEAIGYIESKDGRKLTFKAGENTVPDISIAPK
jgi:hypothetical protein